MSKIQTHQPLPVDFVAGGCWARDSARNQDALFDFKTRHGTDEVKVVIFLAGHSGLMNTHQSMGEPKIDVGCSTFFFNYAGELTYTPGSANETSNEFMSKLTGMTNGCDARSESFNKKKFLSFIEAFKDANLTHGSPLSLYEPSEKMDDLIVLTEGSVEHDLVDASNPHRLHSNPSSVRMFLKLPLGSRLFDFRTFSHDIVDMWQHTGGNLDIQPTADGGISMNIPPYVYVNPDRTTYRNVQLSDIYAVIKIVVSKLAHTTDDAAITAWTNQHVVLVSLGCRVLADGTVHRVESVPRIPSVSPKLESGSAHAFMDAGTVAGVHEHGFSHWPLPTPGSGESVSLPRPDGGKKKQRRRQTRNRKYKLSKKKSTKRVRRS